MATDTSEKGLERLLDDAADLPDATEPADEEAAG